MKRLMHFGMLLMAALAICLLLTPTDAEAATYEGLTYTISNGEATITDCLTSISGTYTIPSSINGYPVTAIGEKAFSYCTQAQSIVIPNSVRTIGYRAFDNCYGLQSIVIPYGVHAIGDGAFRFCTKATSVSIPPILLRAS